MSKVDAQRAMKAARHARTEAAATPPPVRRAAAPAAPAPVAPVRFPPSRAPGDDAAPSPAAGVAAPSGGETAGVTPAGTALCGHRNMAGKECRRPAGHSEKSHRYS